MDFRVTQEFAIKGDPPNQARMDRLSERLREAAPDAHVSLELGLGPHARDDDLRRARRPGRRAARPARRGVRCSPPARSASRSHPPNTRRQ